MCDHHGDEETCEICEAPAQLAVLNSDVGSGAEAVQTSVLNAPSIGHISGLLSGDYWGSTSLTFGFTTSASQYSASDAPNGERASFSQLSNGGKEIFRDAIGQWDEVSGLALSEAGSPGAAEIRIAGSNAPSTAWAYYPNEGWGGGGDVWANTNYIPAYKSGVGDSTGVVGTYAYTTAMHEIGHALGMEHPHDGTVMSASYDSIEYSVMSYKSYVGHTGGGYTNESHGYAQSLMMLDIAAIQSVYGADYSTRSGDTTYGFDPDTGEMTVDGVSHATPAQNRVFRTLWDGNGFDTLDFAAYSTDIRVDLNPGEATDLDVGGLAQKSRLGYKSGNWVYASANIYMSLLHEGDARSLIEAAVCGSGDDMLIGNSAANLFCGGLGEDTYTLGAGNDTVSGTLDELLGDIITDFGAGDRVTATDIGSDKQIKVGNDGVIRLVDAGSSEDPEEPADPGDPDVDDPDETPIIWLTDARDRYESALDDNQIVLGLNESDMIETGAGADRLVGGEGNDNLRGGAGSDTLEGGNGKDRLDGEGGDDILQGGGHRDTLRGRNGNDLLFGEEGADTLIGDDGDDSLSGGDGDDKLVAGRGRNLLYGDAGNDKITGGKDQDLLYGGTGADTLDGGKGADIFVFHASDSGTDTIKKFAFGRDVIRIEGFSGDFDDLGFTESRKGTTIDLGGGARIFLQSADIKDVQEGDFAFSSGTETDRALQAVSLGDIVDTGSSATNLTDAADELKLTLKAARALNLRDGDDEATAGRGDDTIDGGAGDDTINGGSGDDLIMGGSGSDDLTGGSGDDVFEFRASDSIPGQSEFDTIRDLKWRDDTIRLVGFEADSIDDLAFSLHRKKAQIVVDDELTIWLKNMGDHDAVLDHDLIEFA